MKIGDRMNAKVVVVWIFAIVVCTGIGIFGFFNRDLLVEPTVKEEYRPIESETNIKPLICRNQNGSLYQFAVDTSINQIKNVTIQYTNKEADIDTFTAASNLNNLSIEGMTTSLSGTSTDITLNIMLDLSLFNAASVASSEADTAKLNLALESILVPEEYQNRLNQTGTLYTCD